MPEWSPDGGYCIDPLFGVKSLAEKPKEFNIGTH